jgi:hypothetical protein
LRVLLDEILLGPVAGENVRRMKVSNEMMVLLRFGGDADDLLPRYLAAANRWRKDEATKGFAAPLVTAHMKTGDGLLVMNLFRTNEEHKNFGLNMGPHLEEEGLTRPWVEHFPVAKLGWDTTDGIAELSE